MFYRYGECATRIHAFLSNGSRFNYQGSSGWWAASSGYCLGKVIHTLPGDFNGDGRTDIAAVYDYGGSATRIHVFLSNGSRFNYQGSSGWWSRASGYTANRVTHALPGDFNGDGKSDVALLYDYGGSAARIHVFLSNGSRFNYQGSSGWWSRASGYDLDRVVHAIPGDFNGDGRGDIATVYDYGGSATRIHVFLSNGSRFNYQGSSGWWSRASGYTANRVTHALPGDFNGDGKSDVALLYDYGGSAARIHVFLSNGSRFNYQGASGWWSVASGYDLDRVVHAIPGDFNGDGRGDIATVYDYGGSATRIHVFLSNGSKFNYQRSSGWWSVASGYTATATLHSVPGDSRLRGGDGDGPTPTPADTSTPTPTNTPTATATPTQELPQGDVNCDGQFNVVDALFILQYEVGLRVDSGGCPLPPDALYVAAGDVNKDGLTNVVDALFILQCEVGVKPGANMGFC